MNHEEFVLLTFDPVLNKKNHEKELTKGLSAIIRIENELWVANDESTSLERLSIVNSNTDETPVFGNHKQFVLDQFLDLPLPVINDKGEVEEIDIEGLDYRDGYLWLVGSHSLKRSKADPNKSLEKNFERLAKVSMDGNRYLLARIPLIKKGDNYILVREANQNGNVLTAAKLSDKGKMNDLIKALGSDPHLQKFLDIPGKDNGFDIEGLAAGKNGRIFIGIRGPVLRGWAVVLELQLETSRQNPFEIKMRNLGPGDLKESSYRKHFLDLAGLGIRDLCIDGTDLLILAGPSMELDGPVSVFRWKDGIKCEKESLVWNNNEALQKLIDIPFGQGFDHAEGITGYRIENNRISSLLVVYDAASEALRKEPSSIRADIYHLQTPRS